MKGPGQHLVASQQRQLRQCHLGRSTIFAAAMTANAVSARSRRLQPAVCDPTAPSTAKAVAAMLQSPTFEIGNLKLQKEEHPDLRTNRATTVQRQIQGSSLVVLNVEIHLPWVVDSLSVEPRLDFCGTANATKRRPHQEWFLYWRMNGCPFDQAIDTRGSIALAEFLWIV